MFYVCICVPPPGESGCRSVKQSVPDNERKRVERQRFGARKVFDTVFRCAKGALTVGGGS